MGKFGQTRLDVWQNNIPLDLGCYIDSDSAGDKTTRRSTSGWLCSLLGTPLSYASRTQTTVTLSSAEAELMELSSGMTEALHLQQPIQELQTGMSTTIFSYNNKKCRQYVCYKPGRKTWSQQEITTYLTTISVDSRPMTSWRSGHTTSHYSWESCRHLHKASTCSYTTKASISKWASTTTRWERGKKSACTTAKAKRRTTRTRTTKAMTMMTTRLFNTITTTTSTRPSSSTRSKMENYKSKLKNYDNWLEREMQKYET